MGQPRHPRIKPLTVKSLLTGKPLETYTVDSNMPIREALQRMSDHDLGALVVVDDERLLGIISQRSLIRQGLLADDFAPSQPVSQVMTTDLVSASPLLEAQDCLVLMDAERLDFIPVLEHDKVIGLLSISELQRAIIAQYESIFKAGELDQRIMFLQGTYSC